MTMITPSYLGETIEYSSLHACRSTLEDPMNFERDFLQQILDVQLRPEPAADPEPSHQGEMVPIPIQQPAQGGAVARLGQGQKRFGIRAPLDETHFRFHSPQVTARGRFAPRGNSSIEILCIPGLSPRRRTACHPRCDHPPSISQGNLDESRRSSQLPVTSGGEKTESHHAASPSHSLGFGGCRKSVPRPKIGPPMVLASNCRVNSFVLMLESGGIPGHAGPHKGGEATGWASFSKTSWR